MLSAPSMKRRLPILMSVVAIFLVILACTSTGTGSSVDTFTTSREDTISYGETSSGNLDSLAEAHNIYFDGTAGDTVVIEATGSGGTDPRIRLLGPNGDLVAENDDSGGTLDSYLELNLPDTGQYTIRVDVFSTGDYTVSLEQRQ